MDYLIRGEVPEFVNGYGYGSGDGYGSGSGSGSGDGSGSGSGSGSGDGYGSGYGYGYGSGDGSGSGDGYGFYWLACLRYFAAKWTSAQKSRLAALQAAGARIAFWRSNEKGSACQGGANDPVRPGTVEKVKGPLQLCSARALHATLIPPKWPGARLWVVALIGEVEGGDEKYGALEREILGEVIQ